MRSINFIVLICNLFISFSLFINNMLIENLYIDFFILNYIYLMYLIFYYKIKYILDEIIISINIVYLSFSFIKYFIYQDFIFFNLQEFNITINLFIFIILFFIFYFFYIKENKILEKINYLLNELKIKIYLCLFFLYVYSLISIIYLFTFGVVSIFISILFLFVIYKIYSLILEILIKNYDNNIYYLFSENINFSIKLFILVIILLFFSDEINLLFFSVYFFIIILIIMFLFLFNKKYLLIFVIIGFMNLDAYNKIKVNFIENHFLEEIKIYQKIYKIEDDGICKITFNDEVSKIYSILIENKEYSSIKFLLENYIKNIEKNDRLYFPNDPNFNMFLKLSDKKEDIKNINKIKYNEKTRKLFLKLYLLKYKDFPSLSEKEIEERRNYYKDNYKITSKYF